MTTHEQERIPDEFKQAGYETMDDIARAVMMHIIRRPDLFTPEIVSAALEALRAIGKDQPYSDLSLD